jgi:RNA polymerase sigma-70 factor (ECF subfamily)
MVSAAEYLDISSIFSAYKSKVYHLALSIAKDEKDAQDIVENTFLKVMRKIDRFKGKARLSTWIYRIAYNEALMFLRKRRRQNSLGQRYSRTWQGVSLDWPQLPDAWLLQDELKTRIDSVIKSLPISYRMPLLLHIIHGESIEEAARILGLRKASVKTRLHRAYLMVKDEIEQYNQDKAQQIKPLTSQCQAWTGFVHNYATGELENKKQLAFKKHTNDCPQCDTFLKAYQEAIKITGSLQCQDIPLELQKRIQSFLADKN